MAEFKQEQRLAQIQTQKQVQRMSQRQIQAVNMLAMKSSDLRSEIYRTVNDNPALEIVSDPMTTSTDQVENWQRGNSKEYSTRSRNSADSDAYNQILEANEDRPQTLQQHLMEQLNMLNISSDEYDLCQKLIYNLDKNGFYGSMLKPETLLDKSRPLQNQMMLEKCLSLVQKMDPVGTCCRTPEESLFVQAKVNGDASELTLFILDGHLELLNPPEPGKILKNVKNFQQKWYSKSFAAKLPIDNLKLSEEMAAETLKYVLSLNPHPASEFISDTSSVDFEKPDVILIVEKKAGTIQEDDFSSGKVRCDSKSYFQIKYASGTLPQVRLTPDYKFDKKLVTQAMAFLSNLEFRESTIILQGCAIVKAQKQFFEQGPGHLSPLTRRSVAAQIGVHESTVSRMSSKHNSKYIQTQWGLFPASYFFCSGVNENSVSSEQVKAKIIEITQTSQENLSDSKLTQLLNQQGIQIARRTVAKYRSQIGMKNSYYRK